MPVIPILGRMIFGRMCSPPGQPGDTRASVTGAFDAQPAAQPHSARWLRSLFFRETTQVRHDLADFFPGHSGIEI